MTQQVEVEMMTKRGSASADVEGNWSKMNVSNINDDENREHASSRSMKIAKFATTASWIVNWFLLAAKAFCVAISGSKAVSAALADSAVDLVSQGVLGLAESYMNKHSPEYPVGRSRLEALSVLTCAFIMTAASVEVIQFSIMDIVSGVEGQIPNLAIGTDFYVIFGIGIVLKAVLWVFCKWANSINNSDTLEALAEDHLNDVFSNSAAIITASIAFNFKIVWWIDPVGAIVISVIIIYRWILLMLEQVKKIVGYIAPTSFVEQVEEIARSHDTRIVVDCTRAYHFGARYNVEMEIVLPGDMILKDSHDIALGLQHKIEILDDVERAFVHVDHELRDGLEHKVERTLVKGSSALTTQTDLTTNPLSQISSKSDDSNTELGKTL